MTHARTMHCGLLGLAAVLVIAATGFAAGEATLGRNVVPSKQVSFDQIDHSAWDALLQKYVDPAGYVDYTAWKASAADSRSLDAYLTALSRASLKAQASREAKIAFWINAYNAVTVKGILREYPTDSIRNHTAKLWGYNIWDDLYLAVGDGKYSLNQMEHEILRKAGEPRIHFAIVCASIGCPRLLGRAYTPAQLDAQLTVNAQQFFSDPTKFRYDTASSQIWVSPILNWFAADFGANQAAQMATIAPYLPDEAAQQLATSGSAGVTYLEYDWDLNDQAKLGRQPGQR